MTTLTQALLQNSQQPLSLGSSGQSQISPNNLAIAQALQNRQPVRTPLQGISNLANALVAKCAVTKQQQAQDARRQAAADTLREAFTPVTPQTGPVDSGLPTVQPTLNSVAQALLKNPDTVRIGANLLIQQLVQSPGDQFAL